MKRSDVAHRLMGGDGDKGRLRRWSSCTYSLRKESYILHIAYQCKCTFLLYWTNDMRLSLPNINLDDDGITLKIRHTL